MPSGLSEVLARVKKIEAYFPALREFTTGVAEAKRGSVENKNDLYTEGLKKVKAGASAMVAFMQGPSWSKLLAQPGYASPYVATRAALQALAGNPAGALRRTSDDRKIGDKVTAKSPSGEPFGFALAQSFADLAVVVETGEWEEAQRRRALTEAALAAIFLSPLGVGPALLALDPAFPSGIGDYLGLPDVGKQAGDLFVGLKWIGIGIAAVAGVVGLAIVVKAVK